MGVGAGRPDGQRVVGDQPFQLQPSTLDVWIQRAAVELDGMNRPGELDEGAAAWRAAVKGDCGVGAERLVPGREIQPDVVVLDGDQAGSLARLAARQVVVYRPTLGAALSAEQQRGRRCHRRLLFHGDKRS